MIHVTQILISRVRVQVAEMLPETLLLKKARSLSVVLKERLHELPKLLLRTTGSEPAPRCLLLHKTHDTKCLP